MKQSKVLKRAKTDIRFVCDLADEMLGSWHPDEIDAARKRVRWIKQRLYRLAEAADKTDAREWLTLAVVVSVRGSFVGRFAIDGGNVHFGECDSCRLFGLPVVHVAYDDGASEWLCKACFEKTEKKE